MHNESYIPYDARGQALRHPPHAYMQSQPLASFHDPRYGTLHGTHAPYHHPPPAPTYGIHAPQTELFAYNPSSGQGTHHQHQQPLHHSFEHQCSLIAPHDDTPLLSQTGCAGLSSDTSDKTKTLSRPVGLDSLTDDEDDE